MKPLLSTALTRRALVAGRSPQFWQRYLLRETTWLSNLPLTYAWIKTLDYPVFYQLNNQPLFGQGLAALTHSVEEDSSNAVRSPQVRQLRQPLGDRATPATQFPNPTQAASRPIAVKDLVAGEKRSQLSLASPLQLSQQVDQQRLSDLVGATPSPSFSQPSAPIHLPSTPAQPLPLSNTDQDWRQRLTQRVQHALRQPAKAAQQPASIQPSAPVIVEPTCDQEPASFELWTKPLAGRTVSLALLTEVQQRQRQTSQQSSKAAKPTSQPSLAGEARRSPLLPTERTRERSPIPINSLSQQQAFSDVEQWQASTPASKVSAYSPIAPAAIAPPADWDDQLQSNAVHQTAAIEPPTRQPLLPELLPPQTGSVGTTTAPSIRQAIRQEDGAEAELDWLAVSLKRILDEEARRHGIDV